jgi:hypothetical protein
MIYAVSHFIYLKLDSEADAVREAIFHTSVVLITENGVPPKLVYSIDKKMRYLFFWIWMARLPRLGFT